MAYVQDCLALCTSFHTDTDANVYIADGLTSIVRTEGVQGLFRGTSLALFGVSNGAIQFVAYEKMKEWGFERKKKHFQKTDRTWTAADSKLVSTSFLSLVQHSCIRTIVEHRLHIHVRSE